MILKFEEWLVAQRHRDDLIGDLARLPSLQNVTHETSKRKVDEHRDWANVMIGVAIPGYITIFNEAWQEFLLAKQAAPVPID